MQMTTADRRVILFWCVAAPALFLWWFFLRWMQSPQPIVAPLAFLTNLAPLHSASGDATRVVRAVSASEEARTYLVLVQDTHTVRPTGGKVRAAVMVRMHRGVVREAVAYDPALMTALSADLSTDARRDSSVPATINPLTMGESNWFADFPTSARIAAHIYRMHDPATTIDAVFAVDAAAFDAILAVTGPVRVGACTVYSGEDIVRRRCVEGDGGVERAEMPFVADALSALAAHVTHNASVWQKMALLRAVVQMGDAKNVQMAPVKTMGIDAPLRRRGWDGRSDTMWAKDYVMVDEGTMAPDGADAHVTRTMTYDVDVSGAIPQAVVTMHYTYGTADVQKSVAPRRALIRLTTLRNAWFTSVTPCDEPAHYGIKYGRRYAACMVTMPYGSTTDVVFRYNLPIDLHNHYPYDLKMQRQAGVGDVPMTVIVRRAAGEETSTLRLWRDMTLRRAQGVPFWQGDTL